MNFVIEKMFVFVKFEFFKRIVMNCSFERFLSNNEKSFKYFIKSWSKLFSKIFVFANEFFCSLFNLLIILLTLEFFKFGKILLIKIETLFLLLLILWKFKTFFNVLI